MPASKPNLLASNNELVPDFLNRFEEVCGRCPAATAIIHEGVSLTYRQLDELANRIANYLLAYDPAPGQRIGLCLDRSALAIAAMIGVMRSGSAFVPLDPEYPVERLRYMVSDAEIQIILCDQPYRDLFVGEPSEHAPKLIDPKDDPIQQAPSTKVTHTVSGDTLAYIMYTSGSTGNPKGVEIQHAALATYCQADIEVYNLTADDRTLQFSTLNFDIAIEEIFPPLLVGGSVVVRPLDRSDDENELSSIVRRHRITALHLATAYWHEWVDLIAACKDTVPETLRMVLATGEKVSPSHYQRWLSLCNHDVLWCNAYGPTETTVTATVFIPEKGWSGESMPIGKPLMGYTAHILDANDRPLGVGETGDLYIGGGALARGYLNLPEKTASVFRTVMLPDQHGVAHPTRIYKTGDLARWLPCGNIEFAGRIDHQIKLGSYRIEPGEIEYHFGCHPQVLEALVTYDEVEGKKTLIAYMATGNEQVDAATLVQFLKDRVPVYMIPTRYCFCDAFPKTINGKIDRKQLPDPSTGQVPRLTQFGEPRNDLERMLVDLWGTVLGVSGIGIHDDFFAIGGSSLLVTRVIAGIRSRYDLAIPVRDFFANPTIASIARLLAERLQLATPDHDPDALSESLRKRLPVIDPFYFASGQHQLFAVRYVPQADAKRLKHGVLVCNADGHEYARAHRNLQQMAIQLAGAGLDVMRFDFSGCGNSSGTNAEGRTDDWMREIGDAAEEFRKRADLDRLSVLGIRLGATLACSASYNAFDSWVLLDPVASGARYLDMLDRFQYSSLNHAVDYAVRVKSTIPQTFGVELPDEKRRGYFSIGFPASLDGPRRGRVVVITSAGYREREQLPCDHDGLRFIETSDEILWHERQFTESAFSAPNIADAVLQTLQTTKE
jgi:amino acid adenylation domain-containing protein